MVMNIYKRAFSELMKKPFRLWGITLLAGLFTSLGYTLGGPVLVIGVCVAILLQAALANIYLKSYIGGEQIHVVDLFTTFRDWKTIKRVVCSIAWGDLWKYLWLLIPIAGPVIYIIKSYEFALIPYIVMDQPETGITDCKEVSSSMTKGYKGKMFLADILVFIFYGVAVLILSLLAMIPYVGVLFTIINVLFNICFVLLIGLFLNIVHASFYEEIKNAPQEAQYPPQGAVYYQQGAQYYPPQGVQYPQQGAQYPQQGVQYPQQGAQYPQQGAQYPQQGVQYPQQGAQYPQQGAQYPQQGAQYPQQGAQNYPPQQ